MPPLFRIAPQSPRPRVLAALVLGGHLGLSMAQGLPRPEAWEAGVVLDVASSSQALALGARDKGLGLGHSDLLVRGPLGQHLSAEANVGLHTQDRQLEAHIENAWLQTRSLPAGLQARAGRFASQIGYLNEQHPHADDFSERPLLYRALLGGHWYDDGMRLNWTAPTPFYLRLGAEVFKGKQLVPQAPATSGAGARTLNLKVGDDLGESSSWQWGLSRVDNRRVTEVAVHEPDAGDHDHAHAASYSGRRMWVSDLVWKWAPQGNNRQQQLRLSWELAEISGIHRDADPSLRHRASTLAAVWRLNPSWELGLRSDWLRVQQAENDAGTVHVAAGRLREHAIMLAYKPTHMQTLRLQLTQQRAHGANDEGAPVFANPARRSIVLQYVISFGAHGAHSF